MDDERKAEIPHLVRATRVLHCDADSITFVDQIQGRPIISCPETATAIRTAANQIRSGDVVAFPTETVYGLGASALSSTAVSKIFKTKGRPSDNPLIVHVSSIELLKSILPSDWRFPKIYQALMEAFWPGPLTFLMPVTSHSQPSSPISTLVTCGLSTVAVRMPANPISRALIAESGVPIAAPSANLSGRPSPTTAQHVERDLSKKIETILDGGPCRVGVESTVVDGLNPDGRIRILRLGGLSVEDIETCLVMAGLDRTDGEPTLAGIYNQNYRDQQLERKPTTPGMKYKHYAPRAKVIILNPLDFSQHSTNLEDVVVGSIPTVMELMSELNSNHNEVTKRFRIGLMLVEDSPLYKEFAKCAASTKYYGLEFCYSNLGRVNQPEVSAQRLFGALRYLDEDLGVDLIYAENHSELGLGATVMERLKKASGQSSPRFVNLCPETNP